MAPTIHTPVKEFTGTVASVMFVDGVGKTTNETAIAYFEQHGYTVATKKPPFPDGVPVEAWKSDELRAYAAAHNVDLAGATTKADILAAIAKATETAQGSGGQPPA